jgi:lipopolysaccharide/colanic/teichoic acid biosynthesis glycosyltransferase
MANWDSLAGSWASGISGSLLAQIAAAAPTFDRVASRRSTGRLPRAAFRTASASAPSVDVVPDATEDHVVARTNARRNPGPVLGEDLFRSALSRERKRADRFDEVFALITIPVVSSLAGSVASALSIATRETDVVGWLEEGAVLGVILAEVSRPNDDIARRIDARLKRELERRVGPVALERMEMRWYVHAGPGASGAEGLSEADPLIADIQAVKQRRTGLDAFKRALDVVGSLGLMLLLLPVLVLVALLVKLTSRGPMLFKQVRVGQLAKPFTMLKFRTMYVNNDSAVHQQFVMDFIKSSGRKKKPGGETFFKIRNDPRIASWIGHVLRRTSVDELPQLWNVLRGDMSLVGPRPPLHYEFEHYRSWHWRRVLEAKPGVTGLWQVAGRSRTTFDEMVRLDLRYVKTRSFWTDVRILLATPRAVVTRNGAC